MIQEYRKASAEKLGFEKIKILYNKCYVPDGDSILMKEWQPDKDANQREMIEDWLIGQGYRLAFDFIGEWHVQIKPTIDLTRPRPVQQGHGESKSVAFMKAFMEYLKQKR